MIYCCPRPHCSGSAHWLGYTAAAPLFTLCRAERTCDLASRVPLTTDSVPSPPRLSTIPADKANPATPFYAVLCANTRDARRNPALPRAHFTIAARALCCPFLHSPSHTLSRPQYTASCDETSFARLPTSPIRPARHPRASFADHGPRHQHSPLNISLHPRHCF